VIPLPREPETKPAVAEAPTLACAAVLAKRSLSAARSSIDSARSFFGRRFSSSRLFRRCASYGPIPPYFAFQR